MHENNWKEQDFKIDFEPFEIKGVPKKLDENNKTMPHVSVQVSNIYSSSDTHFFRGLITTVHFPEVFSGKKKNEQRLHGKTSDKYTVYAFFLQRNDNKPLLLDR